jgi:hypothetical protein
LATLILKNKHFHLGDKKRFLGMEEATIEDLAFPNWPSKEPDEVRLRGCIEHSFGKEVGSSLNRGHPSSVSRANTRSSAAAEKGGEGMALRI